MGYLFTYPPLAHSIFRTFVFCFSTSGRDFNRRGQMFRLTPLRILVIVSSHRMAQLIGMKLLETAVKAAIATGRVSNSESGPLSLLLIATPESGKTSVVSRKCNTVLSFTDITGRGIVETVKKNPKITHLILLDMIALMSHKQHVNQYTFSMLNGMVEEGLGDIAFPMQTDKFEVNGNKKGLIGCLTIDMVRDGRHWWNKTGFASRMLPICFDHSPGLTIQIKKSISSDKATTRPTGDELILPEESIRVELSDKLAIEVQRLAELKSAEFQENKGYRRLKQFRSLVKGHALLQAIGTGWADLKTARVAVDTDDLKFLEQLMAFISFERPNQI